MEDNSIRTQFDSASSLLIQREKNRLTIRNATLEELKIDLLEYKQSLYNRIDSFISAKESIQNQISSIISSINTRLESLANEVDQEVSRIDALKEDNSEVPDNYIIRRKTNGIRAVLNNYEEMGHIDTDSAIAQIYKNLNTELVKHCEDFIEIKNEVEGLKSQLEESRAQEKLFQAKYQECSDLNKKIQEDMNDLKIQHERSQKEFANQKETMESEIQQHYRDKEKKDKRLQEISAQLIETDEREHMRRKNHFYSVLMIIVLILCTNLGIIADQFDLRHKLPIIF